MHIRHSLGETPAEILVGRGFDHEVLTGMRVLHPQHFRLQKHPRAGAEDLPQLVASLPTGIAEIPDDRQTGF